MAELLELADDALGERLVGTGHDELAVEDVLEEDLVREVFLGERVLDLQIVDVVEELEDVLVVREADHAQERGGEELTTTTTAVEINIKQVVRVELHFKPGAAVRDDAEAVQPAAIQVLGLLKADTRRAMKLGNDHALGSIDDEGAADGHERDFTHVHAFLLGSGLVFEFVGDVKRCGIGLSLANGFEGVELRLADFIEHEIERHLLVVAGDREDFLKDRLQAHVFALGGEDVLLEELLIRTELDLDEIRGLGDFVNLAKVGALGHGTRGRV